MSRLLSRVFMLAIIFASLLLVIPGCGSETSEPEELVSTSTNTSFPKDTNTPRPSPTKRNTAVRFVVIDSAAAEVRDGPDTSFDSLGFARNGDELQVLGTDADGVWYNVILKDGNTAWIHKSFVSKNDWLPRPIVAGTIPPLPLTQTALAPTKTTAPDKTVVPTSGPTRTARPTSTSRPQPTNTSQPVATNTSLPIATNTAVSEQPTNTAEIILPTNTLPPPTEAPPAAPSGCSCSADTLNCSDFSTHNQAQACFNFCFPTAGDIHGLDSDGDGEACESLP